MSSMFQRDKTFTQDFYKLRRQCLAKGTLFEDPAFPAVRKSIFYSEGPKQKLEWKRPGEICKDPKMFVEGASRFDVTQGMLGDCWFVAVLSSLAQHPHLLAQVVPDDNSFSENYAGIIHFRLWRFGEWVDIVIDDRLPTYHNRLIFIHSAEGNEFWSALLEKAYAKLHGSYEALKGGKAGEAMEDFTGGVTETFELKEPPKKLFRIMLKAFERSSMMSCSIAAPSTKEMESKLDNGLIKGHAYTVTGVANVTVSKIGQVQLVRIRNPWGNEHEWNGDWSDRSPQWNLISSEEKKRLGITFDDDGESWMSYNDFVKNFTNLEICSLSLEPMDEGEPVLKFNQSMAQGEWGKGTAGGCRNFPTFESNPQFIIELNEADDDDEDGNCSVLLALMQKGRRELRHLGVLELCIGFSVYKVSDDFSGKLSKQYFDYNLSTATSGSFTNLREVQKRLELPPGKYVIIPCAFQPGEEAEFLLRIFTEKASKKDEPKVEENETGENDARYQLFLRLAGSDKAVDPEELQEILTVALKEELKGNSFRLETCRAMVAALDRDDSGKLTFDEFTEVQSFVRKWKTVFRKYDKRRMGKIEKSSLKSALREAGFESVVNDRLLDIVARYYCSSSGISFDDFCNCTLRLKAKLDEFDKHAQGGRISLSKSEFLEICLK
ncbi:calpain-B-like [Corticium candelabrum]|uniref:calpain-B-like n=1 Tax=Corticium candelabrum TaxID=121492 RepID=UPI002E269800|nr:calpain-B-like [Corticium candelabrum]